MATTSEMVPATGTMGRQEVGGREIQRSGETAVSAAAAQAQAQVQSMYVMALQRPRDMVQVRERLLADARRRGFAETARYSLPRGGKKIIGPSVRFAEAALRALGNIHVRTTITYDDAERRVGEVTVIDLESNLPLSSGFTLDKTVERRKVGDGDVVLGERVNSSGETVYRILATEADVLMKQEGLIARLRRNLALQLLPGDIRDEALEVCTQTLRSQDAADPKAAAKKLADAFGAVGISSGQLREYLGHAVDQVTPDEAEDLRGIYAAIRDGEATWAQVMEQRRAGEGPNQDERAARQELLRRLAAKRVQDRAAYDAALKAAGVKGGSVASLSTEVLERIAAQLGGSDSTSEREPGADDEPDLPLGR